MQELGLQGERQLGDLVQVERALVRILELPGLAAVRTGEGAFLVAEELGLEQPLRYGRAVDLDERPLAARRRRMDGAGDEILADAALAPEQDRRIRVGDVLDDRPDGPHPWASVQKRGSIRTHVPLLAQGLDRHPILRFRTQSAHGRGEARKESASMRLRKFTYLRIAPWAHDREVIRNSTSSGPFLDT